MGITGVCWQAYNFVVREFQTVVYLAGQVVVAWTEVGFLAT